LKFQKPLTVKSCEKLPLLISIRRCTRRRNRNNAFQRHLQFYPISALLSHTSSHLKVSVSAFNEQTLRTHCEGTCSSSHWQLLLFFC